MTIMKTTALALLMVSSAGAWAQGLPCSDATEMARDLASRYNEIPTSYGLDVKGNLLTIFASPGGETWTALIIFPTGEGCIFSSGTQWEMGVPRETGEPS